MFYENFHNRELFISKDILFQEHTFLYHKACHY